MLIGLVGYNVYLLNRPTSNSDTAETTSISTTTMTERTAETSDTPPVVDIDSETQEMLEKFGRNWLNYDSIYKRNQSVKMYLSDEAIETYAIDVDPNVEIEAEGSVTNVFRADEYTYLITGEERSRGNFYKVFIEITLTDDFKINEFFEEKVLHDGTEDDGGRS